MENIDAVIKIGGSIIKRKEILRVVCVEINGLTRKGYKIVIVPGGGEVVECIRKIYKEYKLSDRAAHWMAIKANEDTQR